MSPGDLIVRGRRQLVERIICLPTYEPSDCAFCSDRLAQDADPAYHLDALYLGKRYSTEIHVTDVSDARLATEADHEEARAYADRWNAYDRENGPAARQYEAYLNYKLQDDWPKLSDLRVVVTPNPSGQLDLFKK